MPLGYGLAILKIIFGISKYTTSDVAHPASMIFPGCTVSLDRLFDGVSYLRDLQEQADTTQSKHYEDYVERRSDPQGRHFSLPKFTFDMVRP
jgi:hypothetical protein